MENENKFEEEIINMLDDVLKTIGKHARQSINNGYLKQNIKHLENTISEVNDIKNKRENGYFDKNDYDNWIMALTSLEADLDKLCHELVTSK